MAPPPRPVGSAREISYGLGGSGRRVADVAHRAATELGRSPFGVRLARRRVADKSIGRFAGKQWLAGRAVVAPPEEAPMRFRAGFFAAVVAALAFAALPERASAQPYHMEDTLRGATSGNPM